MDIKFNKGDFVKNRDGRIGYISHICRCNECKKRGFFEPTIEYTDGSKEDISKSILNNVMFNYEQTGLQLFNNEFMLEKLREDNEKLNDLIEFQEKQIERLHYKIECMKKDEDKIAKENHYTHIEKTLLTENGKKFSVGDKIAFRIVNKITGYIDRYIGVINTLKDDCMYLDEVKINRIRKIGTICVEYSDIIPDSFIYTI